MPESLSLTHSKRTSSAARCRYPSSIPREFIDRDGELRKPRPVGQAAVAARAELAAQIAAEVAAGSGGELLQASYKLRLGGHEAALPTTAGDAPPASEPDAPPGASDGGGRPAGSSA